MNTVIILTGQKFSGKDTLALELIDNLGFERVSFSDNHKQIACSLFPWLEPDYPSELKEVPIDNGITTLSPRQIWEEVDKLRLSVDPYMNARPVVDNLHYRLMDDNVRLVVTDLRTEQEEELLRNLEKEGKAKFCFIRIKSNEEQRSEVETHVHQVEVDHEILNLKDDMAKTEILNYVKELMESQ